jgi:Glycosyl hydrolase family 26
VPNHAGARTLLLVAISLGALMVATTLPTLAQYDPERPSSNTGKGGSSPDGGGPGGGDPGGGDPGGGSSRKVALGLATPDAGIAELDDLSAAVGKKPAIWVLWSQWGQGATRDFPMSKANQLASRNIQPMIWWEPVSPGDPDDPTYSRNKNITAGDHDAYIRQWARDAKAFGGNILLRFAQESNNNYFPWSVNSFDNSPTTFKDAWRHVVDIFREEGADNVKWVWSVAKKSCAGGCNPYAEFYPGNAYVDIMAFSAYNWGTHDGKNWTSMYDSFRKVTNKLGEISNKPIMVAETASNSEGGNKPAWIRDGYREVYDQLPAIEAIVYLNADLRDVGHPDWRLTSPAGALTAYAEIAGLARFETRSPFRAHSRAKVGRTADVRKHTARKAPATRKEPVVRKSPKVQKGAVVDIRSKDQAARGSKARVTRKPRMKSEPIEVLDTFNR